MLVLPEPSLLAYRGFLIEVVLNLLRNPEETIGRRGGLFFLGGVADTDYTRDIEERGRQLVAGETLTQVAPGAIRYRTVLIMLGLRHSGREGREDSNL